MGSVVMPMLMPCSRRDVDAVLAEVPRVWLLTRLDLQGHVAPAPSPRRAAASCPAHPAHPRQSTPPARALRCAPRHAGRPRGTLRRIPMNQPTSVAAPHFERHSSPALYSVGPTTSGHVRGSRYDRVHSRARCSHQSWSSLNCSACQQRTVSSRVIAVDKAAHEARDAAVGGVIIGTVAERQTRVASQDDGPRILLELTDAGRALVDAMHAHRQAEFGHAMRDWPPADRQESARLLTRFMLADE